jgi:hypothetical protein
VHYNACGFALDFSRDPYTCLAQLHLGAGAPVVKLRWFFTDLPFLAGETVINNRVFDPQPWQIRPVGELADDTKDWKQNGAVPSPTGLTGKHICSPLFFRTGEPWPNDLPDTIYDADWIPECCERVPPFTPVTPGPNCITAPVLTVGTVYRVVIPAGAGVHWFVNWFKGFGLEMGHVRVIAMSNVQSVTVFEHVGCTFVVPDATLTAPGCVNMTTIEVDAGADIVAGAVAGFVDIIGDLGAC